MQKKFVHKLVAACACCVVLPSAMAAGELTVGTGFNYSSGNYGTATTTNITSIPFLLKYDVNAWTLKLTVPYLYVSGGTGVVPGVGGVENRNPAGRGRAGASDTSQGLGDVVAAATYAAYFNPASQFGVDVTGKVKFATADRNKGLGTGENDYAAQVDLYKGFGPFTLFGGVGYNVLGSSSYIALNNVFNFNVGGAYKLNADTSVGVSYDARERVTATAGPMSEMMGYVSHKLDRHWKSQFYLLKGFESGSPDWGAGASINYAF